MSATAGFLGRSVSIHAPARGGDAAQTLRLADIQHVSIHAPARGATLALLAVVSVAAFQSTPPRGGRPVHCATRLSADVSIHAPREGATHAGTLTRQAARLFQSTPPRGGRRASNVMPDARSACFNPRPRAGGDAGLRGASGLRSFNPRPRAGGDVPHWQRHARQMFQSTPPRGGRPVTRWRICDRIGFNPRPRAGGDVHGRMSQPCNRCFNPRPRAGGDRNTYCGKQPVAEVSIHAPARGATVLLSAYHGCR